MVITRFAPTASGHLHFGGLFNALLNYLFAKQHNGQFNVRVDGHFMTDQRIAYRESMLSSLKEFGLNWDNLILQCDRLEIHKKKCQEFIKNNKNNVYFCDCTIDDLAERNIIDDNLNKLIRPEKYPRPCALTKVKVHEYYNAGKITQITSNLSSRKHSISNLNNIEPDIAKYWEAFDVGYLESNRIPTIRIDLDQPAYVYKIDLFWRYLPFKNYTISTIINNQNIPLAKIDKTIPYCKELRKSLKYFPLRQESICFAAIKTDNIIITVNDLITPLERSYFYDDHCREQNKSLKLSDIKTVLRIKYNPEAYRKLEVNQPYVPVPLDIAFWFNKKPDLVYSSSYDDLNMKATHIIRGNDIFEFFLLEQQVAYLMESPIKHFYFHSMLKDEKGYKYSKFIESESVSEYVQKHKITPLSIINYICYKAGIVDNLAKEYTLEDLVNIFDINKVGHLKNVLVSEEDMIKTIKNLPKE